ncbi:MAG: PKD domain-containing protein, partial [Alphaproteobacteria bacterium]
KNTLSQTTTATKTFAVLAILAIAGLAFGLGDTWRPITSPAGIGERGHETAKGGDDGQLVGSTLISSALAQGSPPPVADAGFDETFAVDAKVTLDGSRTTDPEGELLAFSWSLVSAPANSGAALSEPTTVKPTFTVDQPGDYVFELIVTAGPRTSAPDSVTISTVNSAPVAAAGPDQAIATVQTVELDGSASSDIDGDGLSYAWSLISAPAGSAATFSDASAARPSFFADLAGTYVAQLIVDDGTVPSAADQVTISTANVAPVADAGPDLTAAEGQTVELEPGRSTDVDGDALAYDWALIVRAKDSVAVLTEPTAGRPVLTLDKAGVYVLQLIVDDGAATSAADTVTVSTENTPPVAVAGADQSVLTGAEVTLDGAGATDVDGDRLNHGWAILSAPAGSAAVLDDPTAVGPTFTADIAGDYVAQLIVGDGTERERRDADTVVITTANSAPVAEAGADQSVTPGATVQLDGSASSDPDSDPLTFAWSILSQPAGGAVSLSDPGAQAPTFVATLPGNYIVQLIVADGAVDGAPDTVTISTLNSRPTAAAGPDQTVTKGDEVQLDGGASADADNDALSFKWALIAAPAGTSASISDTTAAAPVFTTDSAGTYIAQLIVSDAALASLPATVVITATNTPPVANAGPDQSVIATAPAHLDGSASSDADEDPLTFAWSLITVPAGSAAQLDDPSFEKPSFTADKPGTYTARLIVNDGFDDSDPDEATVTATNRAPIANAGPDKQFAAGSEAKVDGGGSSDPDGHDLSYAWSLVSVPAGSAAQLTDPNIKDPSFTPDLEGNYVVLLVVNDGFVNSPSDSVVISTFGAPSGVNFAPFLDPVGNQTVALG